MRRAMSGVLSDEVGESGDAEVDDGVVFAVAVDGFGDGGFGGVDGLLALARGDEGVGVARRGRGHWSALVLSSCTSLYGYRAAMSSSSFSVAVTTAHAPAAPPRDPFRRAITSSHH